eukprot:3524222-Prymnesium_polylepis.1
MCIRDSGRSHSSGKPGSFPPPETFARVAAGQVKSRKKRQRKPRSESDSPVLASRLKMTKS